MKTQPYTKHTLLVIVLGTIMTVSAQTTNTGLIAVNPDTQWSVLDDFTNQANAQVVNDGEAFFYRDFTNDGMVDFRNTGLARFQGNALQTIAGGRTSYFHDLAFNNSSDLPKAIDLTGSVNVQHQIDFSEGIVNTIDNNGTFVLQNNGTAVNTSDASFVDGFITKEGANGFEFPIGDNRLYRYAAISAPANASASYRARYVYQDAENIYPARYRIGNVVFMNDQEYWIVENTDGEQMNITLSWDAATTPDNIILEPEEDIRMARWNPEQGAWEEVPGTTVDFKTRTVTALTTIEGRAVFTIARADAGLVLPDGVVIWNGLSPDNDGKNDYFLIENVSLLPNNSLEIYNRWGSKIFETTDYGTNGNVFEGFAQGRDRLLPSGTYFYVLKYDATGSGSTRRVEKTGYLFITTD